MKFSDFINEQTKKPYRPRSLKVTHEDTYRHATIFQYEIKNISAKIDIDLYPSELKNGYLEDVFDTIIARVKVQTYGSVISSINKKLNEFLLNYLKENKFAETITDKINKTDALVLSQARELGKNDKKRGPIGKKLISNQRYIVGQDRIDYLEDYRIKADRKFLPVFKAEVKGNEKHGHDPILLKKIESIILETLKGIFEGNEKSILAKMDDAGVSDDLSKFKK